MSKGKTSVWGSRLQEEEEESLEEQEEPHGMLQLHRKEETGWKKEGMKMLSKTCVGRGGIERFKWRCVKRKGKECGEKFGIFEPAEGRGF